MTRAQRELLEIAQRQGWVRPEGANALRAVRVLVREGLLEPHPDYEGETILRPSAEPKADQMNPPGLQGFSQETGAGEQNTRGRWPRGRRSGPAHRSAGASLANVSRPVSPPLAQHTLSGEGVRSDTSDAKPKGRHLTLVCGHEIKWKRPVTATGHVWCQACDDHRKIASVK